MFDYTNLITFVRFIFTIMFFAFVFAGINEIYTQMKRRRNMKERKRIEKMERRHKETPDVLRVNEEQELL